MYLEYSPDFKGAISTEDSVKAVLSVLEQSSVDKGDGGGYYPHKGKGEKWI